MAFLDPDEEFEMMHAEELEMMNQMEEFHNEVPKRHSPKESKRSLNFRTENSISETTEKLNFSSDLNGVFPLSQSSVVSFGLDENNENDCIQIPQESVIDSINGKRRELEDHDLFGDIDDIDFEDNSEPALKRKKINEEISEELSDKELKQFDLIKKIIDERQKHKIGKRTNFLSGSTYNSFNRPYESISRRVPSWSFFPAVDDKDQRVYIRFRSEDAVESEIKDMSWHSKTVQLLSSPANDLIVNAFEKIEKDETMRSAQLQNDLRTFENSVDNTADLWVQKYRPHKYLDLLSDESTNRMLLRWLKLWDRVVFNKEVSKTRRPKNDIYSKYGSNFIKKNQSLDEELDENKCPKLKLALLCGPPGLGKTTLAHLVAHQAGYNVVEINASDDRNPTSFKIQLEASTQMASVISNDCRPNCLVLDEIDGAPATSIDLLIKFSTEKHVNRKKKANKQEEKGSVLKRPIICICNDVYVPALRNLRQNAFVLNFPPTSSVRLAERLMEISSYENIKTDMGAMTALSTKTNNDIRSCLSTLSCFRNQPLRLSHIKNANIGNKDIQKGLFIVWQEIFQIKKSYFDSNSMSSDEGYSSHNNVMKDRIDFVLKTVQSYGDYEKISQGVYENFLSLKHKDSSMSSVVEGLDWFCNFDKFNRIINTSQNYSLYPYLPYSFATWHCLFATFTWPKITYPSASYEVMVRKNKYKQIVDELMAGISPAIRTFLHRDQILLDTMPLVMHIAVPNLRSVSVQLFTMKEKEELAKVINIMIEYGLNFFQERAADGSFNFVLNPSVDDAVKFPGLETFPTLSYATKQLISREIDLEKMRKKMSLSVETGIKGTDNIDENKTAVSTPKNKKNAYNKQVTPNHLMRLTPKIVGPTKAAKRKDFFGREISSPTVSKGKEIRDEIVKSDIWFHFKEGYNNAVRKSVLMKDLY
ncbi:chromosome transmission fidelity protein 18 homolog [Adelges cooleyi]|uniref:chromosome transmission fidelity protein 18 homolog n=1 Tax=Adelges cooleyi TaxID=133065 RepID=UPI00217FCE0F|nr:chromosome transmission fidelity protein 18 homolog [Adelges cooleyi]XP_050424391.1 chromosome transmission fidelity protein 18 homolog [Adelges cooleyi]